MKKIRTPGIQCSEIDNWIAKMLSETISESDQTTLSRHLRECENCRRALSSAEARFSTLHHSRGTSLRPRPSIQHALRKKVIQSSRKQKSSWDIPLEFVIRILKVRVPIYQAVLVMVIFFTIMLYANFLSFSGNPHPANIPGHVQIADSTEFLDTLKIKNDRVGRNLKEDSLLARFFMTVM